LIQTKLFSDPYLAKFLDKTIRQNRSFHMYIYFEGKQISSIEEWENYSKDTVGICSSFLEFYIRIFFLVFLTIILS